MGRPSLYPTYFASAFCIGMDSANNKLIFLPPCIRPVLKGIIINRTSQYTKLSYGTGECRIILPQGKDHEVERKYDVAEVMAIGKDVEETAVGDIVLWQLSTGFRIPNGADEPNAWKIEEFAMSVVAVLPNLDPEKRTAKWDGIDEKVLAPYVEMWEIAQKELDKDKDPLAGVTIPAVGRGEVENPDFSVATAAMEDAPD